MLLLKCVFVGVVLVISMQMSEGQIHTGSGGWGGVGDFKQCKSEFREATKDLKPHPDVGLPMDVIIRKYGYPVEKVNVVTKDGYILGQRRKAVLLEHGLMCNSHAWIVQPYSRNLAMLLADSGFDVFIGNTRGNSYSQTHIDPKKGPINRSYWDFSFHEMGVYDIPAQIEAILRITGEEKLYYVGMSMGCTRFLIAMSTHTELNDKIATAFLMAPAAGLSHFKSWLRWITAPLYGLQPVLRKALGGRVDHIQKLTDFLGIPLGMICARSSMACGLCSNVNFLLFGYDGPQTNYTSIPLMVNIFPEAFSTKTVVHFAQNYVNNQFSQFDYGEKLNMKHYGQPEPPIYDMQKITAPTIIYYGLADTFVPKEDAYELARSMNASAIKEVNEVPFALFNHADFIVAKDADDLLYKDIRDKIQNSLYG